MSFAADFFRRGAIVGKSYFESLDKDYPTPSAHPSQDEMQARRPDTAQSGAVGFIEALFAGVGSIPGGALVTAFVGSVSGDSIAAARLKYTGITQLAFELPLLARGDLHDAWVVGAVLAVPSVTRGLARLYDSVRSFTRSTEVRETTSIVDPALTHVF